MFYYNFSVLIQEDLFRMLIRKKKFKFFVSRNFLHTSIDTPGTVFPCLSSMELCSWYSD